MPNGWAFSIWGIIFLTLGLYTIYQVVPDKYGGGLECDLVQSIRAPVLAMEAFNSVWNFLFGWEEYWMALLDIVLYCSLLWVILCRLDINVFAPIAGVPKGRSIRTKLLVVTPFSIHASWVTVATALNVQINLLEEGWLPSPGFSIGCCWTAVAVGLCLTIVRHANLPYALTTIWALGGIISNQSPTTSTFGCASRICSACNRAAAMPICARLNAAAAGRPPNGWAGLHCAAMDVGVNATFSSGTALSNLERNHMLCVEQVVPKSPAVVWWSVAGMGCVAVAFAAGLVMTIVYGHTRRAHQPMALATDAKGEIEDGLDAHHPKLKATPETAVAM